MMSKIKKALVILSACLLVLLSVYASAADGDAVITASAATGKPGDSVTIVISLENCVEIKSGAFLLEFDASAIEITDCRCLAKNTVLNQFDSMKNVLVFTYNANTDANGALFELTCKIKDDAPSGEYKISFERAILMQSTDGPEKLIPSTTVSGSITVGESAGCEHEWVWSIDSNASCESPGVQHQQCAKCGETQNENSVIPALGHNYEISVNDKGENVYTCSRCGDTYTESGFMLGDVNGDKKITSSDARIILRISAQLDIPTASQSLASDINGDKKITSSDARIALRISAKLESIDDYIKKSVVDTH